MSKTAHFLKSYWFEAVITSGLQLHEILASLWQSSTNRDDYILHTEQKSFSGVPFSPIRISQLLRLVLINLRVSEYEYPLLISQLMLSLFINYSNIPIYRIFIASGAAISALWFLFYLTNWLPASAVQFIVASFCVSPLI